MSGIAIVKLQDEEYECSTELAEAIDAALEQARRDARYEAYGDMLDAVISDWRERYSEPMTIGEVESIVRMYVEKALEQARRESKQEAVIAVCGDDVSQGPMEPMRLTYGQYIENLADAKAEGAAEERERIRQSCPECGGTGNMLLNPQGDEWREVDCRCCGWIEAIREVDDDS
jgi:hypothetical protein